jgi:hypothetical protein
MHFGQWFHVGFVHNIRAVSIVTNTQHNISETIFFPERCIVVCVYGNGKSHNKCNRQNLRKLV